MKFTPTQDFHDADLQSEYLVGFTYTVRSGNDRLAAKVAKWIEAGLVKEGPATTEPASPAKLRGAGTVK